MKALEELKLDELQQLRVDISELLLKLRDNQVILSHNDYLNEHTLDCLYDELDSYKEKVNDEILDKQSSSDFTEKDCDVYFIENGKIHLGLLKDWQGDTLEIRWRNETIFKQKSECCRNIEHFLKQIQFELADDYEYILEA